MEAEKSLKTSSVTLKQNTIPKTYTMCLPAWNCKGKVWISRYLICKKNLSSNQANLTKHLYPPTKKGNPFRDISNTRCNWYFIILCYKRLYTCKGLYMQMKTTVLTDILTVTYVSSQILYYLYSGFEEQ